MQTLLRCFAVTALLLVPALAGAQQVASVLVQNNADLPGGPAGNPVSSITTPAVNNVGGYCFGITTTGTDGVISRFWGSAVGGPGLLIRSEATIGNLEQTAFESFFGFSNEGEAAYSPTCNNLDSGSGGLDSVWYGDLPVAVEEEVYPHLDGWFWRFASRPGTTGHGVPHFVGGITNVQGGSTQNRGLFYGFDGAPVLVGGDNVDGVAEPLNTGTAVTFDYRFSAYGAYYICQVYTTAPTATNRHVVMNGAVVTIDGMPMSRGSAVPAMAGGLPGENWENFDSMGVTESGYYMVTGDNSGATTTDEFILINGTIVLREGDLVGGYPLVGAIERAYMSEDGDWAAVWAIDIDGTNHEVLLLNGEIMVMEGDAVDYTGDGLADPDHVLTDFTGIAALAVGDRGLDGRVPVYFVADIVIPDMVAPRPLADENTDLDAAGRTEPEELPTRAMVRAGMVVYSEQVVPVMLARFEAQPANDGALVSWTTPSLTSGVFELVAQRGAQSWVVPYLVDGRGGYEAHDLLASGTVTYALYLRDGNHRVMLGSKTVELALPAAGLELLGAFPNPFNPQTRVAFAIGHSQPVKVAVHALDGRQVAVLADQIFVSGRHQVTWNGMDQAGQPVPSGTYLARVMAQDGVQSAKLMLVK